MKNFKNFTKLNESAPRIPNSEEYWKKKGKIGKEVMIYFHDDLDGIYSATVMKNYLEGKGFKINGYGIVNYQEGWNTTKLNPKYINIALDYAENVDGIDVYMDHHGSFDLEEVKEREKNRGSVKTETTSAYEGICDQLGLPIVAEIQNVIDMVDSAKYDDYNIDQSVLLDFNPKKFKSKLEFAAAFNQLLKRSDHRTFIEVVANTKDMAPSIYNIYRLFRLLYPANNMNFWELKNASNAAGFGNDTEKYINHLKLNDPELLKTFQKDFLKDAKWRLNKMEDQTRGVTMDKWRKIQPKSKVEIRTQEEFIRRFKTKDGIKMEGYQIIGNMMFVPTGTWANALRARSILEADLKKAVSKLDKEYGATDGLIPTIQYEIEKDSPLYDDLRMKVGQKVEIIGDITRTDYNDLQSINIKRDVEHEKTEGISGFIDLYYDGDDYNIKKNRRDGFVSDTEEKWHNERKEKEGILILRAKQPIFWILLQYGNTFQVASYHKLENYDQDYLPRLKDGTIVANLGKYCEVLLKNFETHYGLDVNAVDGVTTVAGGHKGIGSISNVFGRATKLLNGVRFLDLIKNKMIQDLSGIDWKSISMPWGDESEERKTFKPQEKDMNKKTLIGDDIRKAQDIQK